MKPSGGLTRRKPMRRSRPRRGWAEVRALAFLRAGGSCELCGGGMKADRWECHHRLRRSQGGKDDLATCVALHPQCHAWVHEHPRQATCLGFLVPSHRDPAAWPVRLRGGVWALPSEDGWALSGPLFEQEIGVIRP